MRLLGPATCFQPSDVAATVVDSYLLYAIVFILDRQEREEELCIHLSWAMSSS